MSFIARKFLTDSIENCVLAKDISIDEQKLSFFCPGCTCTYLFRSASSNKRAAHFYKHGSHDNDCWMPDAESISGDVEWDVSKDFNISDFFSFITSTKERSGSGHGSAGGGSSVISKKHLSTIRNLYKFCIYHDNNAVVYDSVKVKDILVARKTSYLYNTYVKGIRLIEAHYWKYNSESHTLFFYYPYSAETAAQAKFKIAVNCNDKEFRALRDKVYSTDRTILLMCDWTFSNNYICGKLINSHQLVVL